MRAEHPALPAAVEPRHFGEIGRRQWVEPGRHGRHGRHAGQARTGPEQAGPTSRCAPTAPSVGMGSWSAAPSASAGGPMPTSILTAPPRLRHAPLLFPSTRRRKRGKMRHILGSRAPRTPPPRCCPFVRCPGLGRRGRCGAGLIPDTSRTAADRRGRMLRPRPLSRSCWTLSPAASPSTSTSVSNKVPMTPLSSRGEGARGEDSPRTRTEAMTKPTTARRRSRRPCARSGAGGRDDAGAVGVAPPRRIWERFERVGEQRHRGGTSRHARIRRLAQPSLALTRYTHQRQMPHADVPGGSHLAHFVRSSTHRRLEVR